MSDEETSFLNIGIAVLFVAYSLFMFILGAWGNSILPASCTNQTLRSSIRALITTGAVSITAMTGYAACGIFCQRTNIDVMPSWFVLFIFVLSIINIVMASRIQSELSSDDPCYTGNSENFKNMNSYGIMVSVFVLLLSLAILGFRSYKKFKARKEIYDMYRKDREKVEKAEGLKQLQKSVAEKEREEQEEIKQLQDKKEALAKQRLMKQQKSRAEEELDREEKEFKQQERILKARKEAKIMEKELERNREKKEKEGSKAVQFNPYVQPAGYMRPPMGSTRHIGSTRPMGSTGYNLFSAMGRGYNPNEEEGYSPGFRDDRKQQSDIN